jgi:hypothetical protein
MLYKIKTFTLFLVIAAIGFSGCRKAEYSFGNIKTPSALTLTAAVTGATTATPNGDGTGSVAITTSATGAITYKIDFGDGNVQMVPSGVINYKYTLPDTNQYTITVNAIGTAGVVSTISKKIKVYVAFVIPDNIVTGLTNGSSKVWICANDVPGHFGVGPADGFTPSYYAAPPNGRAACTYDDEITFAKDASGGITMSVDNKGQSFIIGAAASFYGLASAEDCITIDVSGVKKLVFSNATSTSTPDISTRIQMYVPGNGIINDGTGANSYEILAISATQLSLRNIGADGNSWYQILKVK